jgi:hypothetical protein
LAHSQKFSILLSFAAKPKNLPPSSRMSCRGHFGLAHFEIIAKPAAAS